MSTKTTSYGEKVKQGNRMYGPAPKVPPYPYCLNAEQIREKYGDSTPVIAHDGRGNPIRRSQT